MNVRAKLVFLGLLLAVPMAVQAAPPYFLKENAVDASKLLPAPPGDNCPETKAELELIVQAQKTCTAREVARTGIQAYLSAQAFQDVLGPWFNEEKLPETMALLKRVNREAKYCCDCAKQQFSRRRPRFLDARIKPLFENVDEPCYPSGHAVQSTTLAVVLADLMPEYQKGIMERSREIGWNRIPAGLHYPSDCTAGRVLGMALGQALLADPGFQEELAKAKKEYAAIPREHHEPMGADCK